ncbi:DUF5788 family protein [Methanocella arvoryzae]|uniref:Uncharacterized protein n=1 Tax=Methanocella arvoryzae (strain DSM 22066 / NBRC 105507 / MRE50) TaxID=351160 RepID=Q0W659_METAR|nr:DUF5788 family protein [Methanocella arvoryzae]CAJ36134.1 conserved hypothetical protein [Methanocella arvoryzae MRE50]
MSAIKGTKPGEVLRDVRKLKKELLRPAAPQVLIPPEKRMITPEERRDLELRLHRLLVWVGVMTPLEFELKGQKLPLHDIVWDLLSKDCLTEDEKEDVRRLIWQLIKHEKADEEILHNNDLTLEEAKEIYKEAAGLLRAIMSLKSLVGKKDRCTIRHTVNRRRIEDAQNWLAFIKELT